jgi:hypothetical protein
MTVYSNVSVSATYVSKDSQNAWAYLAGTGLNKYIKIKPGAADGVSNLFVLFCAAQTSGRKVTVDIDASSLITYAYLI